MAKPEALGRVGVGITSSYFLEVQAFGTPAKPLQARPLQSPFGLLLQDWPSPEGGEAEVGAVWERELLWGGCGQVAAGEGQSCPEGSARLGGPQLPSAQTAGLNPAVKLQQGAQAGSQDCPRGGAQSG